VVDSVKGELLRPLISMICTTHSQEFFRLDGYLLIFAAAHGYHPRLLACPFPFMRERSNLVGPPRRMPSSIHIRATSIDCSLDDFRKNVNRDKKD
jgi:hypothetical protein